MAHITENNCRQDVSNTSDASENNCRQDVSNTSDASENKWLGVSAIFSKMLRDKGIDYVDLPLSK